MSSIHLPHHQLSCSRLRALTEIFLSCEIVCHSMQDEPLVVLYAFSLLFQPLVNSSGRTGLALFCDHIDNNRHSSRLVYSSAFISISSLFLYLFSGSLLLTLQLPLACRPLWPFWLSFWLFLSASFLLYFYFSLILPSLFQHQLVLGWWWPSRVWIHSEFFLVKSMQLALARNTNKLNLDSSSYLEAQENDSSSKKSDSAATSAATARLVNSQQSGSLLVDDQKVLPCLKREK